MITVQNPILKGFYPDPSICAVGRDFYLVNSSFAYFPGVPIFHSTDLANWEQIGNILDRNSQIPLTGCGHSQGIYAPTIRYHNGIFYMITTNISGGGNFIVTADRPEGPWSEPYFLGPDAPGIDPSIFFDEDGECYYVGTRPNPEGVTYNGDWEIWIQKLDLQNMKLAGESYKLWKGAMNGVIWPEGPHLYKRNEYYYLMIAEGGTGPDHSVTIARSKNITGPYENNPDNPILTHRHLGENYPIKYVGHGDLVETKDGKWYMVMLASRFCEGFSNLGRETFLAKVTWENDWPIVNAGVGKLEEKMNLELDEGFVMPRESCYHFYGDKLSQDMLLLRNPKEGIYSLEKRIGFLRLYLREKTLKDLATPSYIGIRQQHYNYMVSTMFECKLKQGEEAGIAIVQSNEYHLRFVKKNTEEGTYLQLIICVNSMDEVLAEQELREERIQLKIISNGQRTGFYYNVKGKELLLINGVDMRNLSTERAGGFVGCTIGMYASSNGEKSNNYADFSWFSYQYI